MRSTARAVTLEITPKELKPRITSENTNTDSPSLSPSPKSYQAFINQCWEALATLIKGHSGTFNTKVQVLKSAQEREKTSFQPFKLIIEQLKVLANTLTEQNKQTTNLRAELNRGRIEAADSPLKDIPNNPAGAARLQLENFLNFICVITIYDIDEHQPREERSMLDPIHAAHGDLQKDTTSIPNFINTETMVKAYIYYKYQIIFQKIYEDNAKIQGIPPKNLDKSETEPLMRWLFVLLEDNSEFRTQYPRKLVNDTSIYS